MPLNVSPITWSNCRRASFRSSTTSNARNSAAIACVNCCSISSNCRSICSNACCLSLLFPEVDALASLRSLELSASRDLTSTGAECLVPLSKIRMDGFIRLRPDDAEDSPVLPEADKPIITSPDEPGAADGTDTSNSLAMSLSMFVTFCFASLVLISLSLNSSLRASSSLRSCSPRRALSSSRRLLFWSRLKFSRMTSLSGQCSRACL